MTAALLQRLSDGYASAEPVLVPLADLLGAIGPDELVALRALGLREHALHVAGAAAPVRAVEVHELVDLAFEHAIALETLAAGRGD